MLYLLSTLIKAKLLTEVFTVRIHSRIARNPWARLWYLCRGIDSEGSGNVTIGLEAAMALLHCSEKTVYRWLQKGKRVGAFRRYRIKNGTLHVYLGSLFKVCWFLNLKHWGVVSECPLSEVNAHIRAITTGIVTQKLQERSRYAATKPLSKNYRKQFGIPHPNELLEVNGQTSLKSAVGKIPFVLHKSSTRLFVSRNFVCYGTNQQSISTELLVHSTTVQRHHKALGLERRQLCQKKGEYAQMKTGLEHDCEEFYSIDPKGSGEPTQVNFKKYDDYIWFTDGTTIGQKKKTPNAYYTPLESFERRLFTITGKGYRTTYLAKCNIYREDFHLTTMRAARRKYRYNLSHGVYSNCHCDSDLKLGRGGQKAFCKKGLKKKESRPGYEKHF